MDSQALQQVALGMAALQQEFARPLLNRITQKMFKLVNNAEAPLSWVDPIQWRPREYNKRADYLCNQCLDTGTSFDHVDPDAFAYCRLQPNWLVYTDGGSWGQGASAYAWVIYAFVHAGEAWAQFCVAFGLSEDQSSVIVEAQGLDVAR